MIRTFLIYRLLDKCLDLFFDRVESVFVPIVTRQEFRVGDRIRKIVFTRKEYRSFTEQSTYYRCEVKDVCDYHIRVSVNTIETVKIFKSKAEFLHYKTINEGNHMWGKQLVEGLDGLSVVYTRYQVEHVTISCELLSRLEVVR